MAGCVARIFVRKHLVNEQYVYMEQVFQSNWKGFQSVLLDDVGKIAKKFEGRGLVLCLQP